MAERAAPVVVGVDGTQRSIHAARWAGALAERLGAPLHIVHARPYPGRGLTDVSANVRAIEMAEQHSLTETILSSAQAAVRAAVPALQVTTEHLSVSVDEALIDLSGRARLIVVGNDEVSPGAAVLVGSSTLAVAAGSRCPLVAWRGAADTPSAKPIVLGMNGHEESHAALVTSFELADALGVEIRAVHAVSTRRAPGDITLPFMIDRAAIEEEQQTRLSERLQPWMDRYPDVKVTCVTKAEKPSRLLLACASDAQFIVVGSRARGPLVATMLGSTGLNLLHHSAISVIICRPSADPK